MKNLPEIRKSFIDSHLFYKEEIITNLNCIITKRVENIFFSRIELIIFTTIGESSQLITKEIFRDFSKACFDNARKEYDGRGLGNNSVVISISVLMGNEISESAKEFCKKPSKLHWASIEINIIYDLSNHQFYNHTGWRFWGGLFYSSYKKQTLNTMKAIRNALLPHSNSQTKN